MGQLVRREDEQELIAATAANTTKAKRIFFIPTAFVFKLFCIPVSKCKDTEPFGY